MDYEGPFKSVGKRIFQAIRRKGDKHPKTYALFNGEKILIWDPMQIDNSGNLSTVSINYSYDGEKAAILTQKSGAEVNTVYFIETRTGKQLHHPLTNIGSFQWTKDQNHAYVTLCSEEDIQKQLPLKTYLLKIGEPIEKAKFLGTTNDAKEYYSIFDNRYSDVSFSSIGDFFSNSLWIRTTGSLKRGG